MNAHPHSPIDLAELRAEGVVFVSVQTSRLIARGIGYVCAGMLMHQLPLLFNAAMNHPKMFSVEVVLELLKPWLYFMIVSAGLVAFLNVAVTLLQSKFFFRIQRPSEDASQLRLRVPHCIVDAAATAAFSAFAFYSMKKIVFQNASALELLSVLPRLCYGAAAVMIFQAGIVFFIDRYRFRSEQQKSVA